MARRRILRMLEVRAVRDYVLQVQWQGEPLKLRHPMVELVDLEPQLDEKHGYAALHDPRMFSRFKLVDDGLKLVWPNKLEMSAERINRWSLRQHKHGDTAAFRDWMSRHRFTLEQGAEALGISRRRVAAYSSGEKPVPRVITLACVGHQHLTSMTKPSGRRRVR